MQRACVIFLSLFFFLACSTKHENEKSETMILLGDSLSPDGKMKYLKYSLHNSPQDSSIFWAIVPAKEKNSKIEEKRVPIGYHVQGWTENNELILLKVDTSQMKQLDLKDGMILHGVVVKIKE